MLSNLESGDAVRDVEDVRATLAPVQHLLTRVLPHLCFAGLGDPTSEGSFYFTRDATRGFRYENLCGGEKAVFDLLLDVHIAAIELGTPLICLDEPDIHLNPAVQATELTEVMWLLPNGSHLWIATHSVGMIRRAFDISTAEPGRVALLDFGQVKGPAPDVQLKPSQPSVQLLREAMSVALDGESASSLAPSPPYRAAIPTGPATVHGVVYEGQRHVLPGRLPSVPPVYPPDSNRFEEVDPSS